MQRNQDIAAEIDPERRPPRGSTLAAKRAFDIVVATGGMLVFAPFLAAIALAVKLDSPGPIFFRQERVGLGGARFRIFKFRTMKSSDCGKGLPLTVSNDNRITRLGAILRASKLDEIPQLINVIKGDMSLVGPRPEVPSLMQYYSSDQRDLILSVKPGITDYASLLFRNENELLDAAKDPIEAYRSEIMPVKFRHYARYLSEMSVRNDIRIILATCLLLLTGRLPASVGAAKAEGGLAKFGTS
ncbi:sugar transferase [Methylocystis sp. JAN1]|uniref:sugar transferase n=1 Tax=Methylocystis sp. JAN1 TaxID=3397211 RepID=UPI003FA2C15C